MDEDFDAPEPTEAEVEAAAAVQEKEAVVGDKKKKKTNRYVDPERLKGGSSYSCM